MISLVLRPSPFFVLQFAFGIIHGGIRDAKNGVGLGIATVSQDVWWTRGRRKGGGAHVQITY